MNKIDTKIDPGTTPLEFTVTEDINSSEELLS